MKVLFLIQGWQVAASRYRVLQYLPYLHAVGIKTDVALYPASLGEFMKLLGIIGDYDTIFLQRKRFLRPFLDIFRLKAKRVVFDFDDAIMFRNSKASSPYSKTRLKRFANMVKASDFVIAGNSFLKDQASKFTDRVVIIPTPIEDERYSMKDYTIQKDNVAIGWIGDHGSIHYLEKMRPMFERLGKLYRHVELHIICDTFFDCEHIKVVKKRWSSETEVEDLKALDIGIMPLLDDLWSWGKCGLKILQYFGVGVPAVCTPVGINVDIVKDGVNGLYAKTEEEWIRALSFLIENPDKRKEMGIRGHEVVKTSFSVKACAPKLIDVLYPKNHIPIEQSKRIY
ncbi:MAG: glycosyltransferase family 4 protein [Syntrophorhabdaceae bacterium]|nr:glycosyltransferase family 4 protein [Syntrophorhabdaceae bacterium]